MDELLAWLLSCIVELLLEAIFEFVIVFLADLLLRAAGLFLDGPETRYYIPAYFGYGILGGLLGLISVGFFPHPLVHPARIHGISLFVAPIMAGLLMAATGAYARRRKTRTTQVESFSYGFVFAFGIALMRFLFAK